MAVLIIFLAGAEKTEPRIGCQVVAALLHYFILSTFFWMAVEGLNLYRNFVKVFSGGASNSRFLMNALLFAWGKYLIYLKSILFSVEIIHLQQEKKRNIIKYLNYFSHFSTS